MDLYIVMRGTCICSLLLNPFFNIDVHSGIQKPLLKVCIVSKLYEIYKSSISAAGSAAYTMY